MCIHIYKVIVYIIVQIVIRVHNCNSTNSINCRHTSTNSLTHSLTGAIPPAGGIGGAAHNRSWSIPANSTNSTNSTNSNNT